MSTLFSQLATTQGTHDYQRPDGTQVQKVYIYIYIYYIIILLYYKYKYIYIIFIYY